MRGGERVVLDVESDSRGKLLYWKQTPLHLDSPRHRHKYKNNNTTPEKFQCLSGAFFSLGKQRVGHRQQRNAVPLFGGELFEYGLDDFGRVGPVDAVHFGGARLEVGGRVAAENARRG